MNNPEEGSINPQKIGRYEVETEIGRGGMAVVYCAHDPRFNRSVAIKVLPRDLLANPEFRTRFEREAHTIAALEHPAIVPVYDYGEEDGQPYLVMRYMPGKSLEEHLKQGVMPLSEAARLISRLAPALDKAHTKGIVHRDLKPGNILFDQDGEPYLSDFGIVKLTESTITLTRGGIVGTPAYMSPEQGMGEKSIDGRSDIYSMGVILYQMLSGKVPFEAKTPTAQILMHINTPVPYIIDLRSDLPSAIQRIIERAMAKKREDRYKTMRALAEALEALVESETILPAKTSPGLKTFIEPGVPSAMEKHWEDTRSPQTPVGDKIVPEQRVIPLRAAPPRADVLKIPARPRSAQLRGYPRIRENRILPIIMVVIFVLLVLVVCIATIAWEVSLLRS